ncbi:hypothetical protein GYMLUDRAFT_199049 [Collybiopsis luxurians FD-317 M1]|uniref:Uncharacterized protein n=1 Tax=Collybiopsis luxurians FD-317 M1 TaxID=944289 RepID=A0A0D0CR34_9AGAR|nr:hypothetical protein GYMLUDRAFT_199049 [Collybiopsis luxurians FD-317 M1]
MAAKHVKSQNEEELSTSSSSLDTVTYETAPNYPNSQYLQSNSQSSPFSSVMPRYSDNYSQLTTASYNNNAYGVNSQQVHYPQSSEHYGGSYAHPATWSEPHLPVYSYSTVSGYSGSMTNPNMHPPTRYSSYPPPSYSPSSNYTSYPPSNNQAPWTSSPHSLQNTHALPSYSSPSSSSYPSSSYSPADPFQFSPYLTRPSSAQHSTPGSTDVMLSPYSTGSIPLSASPSGTPPVEALSHYNSSGGEEEPSSHTSATGSPEREARPGQYSHRDQMQFFRDALTMPSVSAVGPFIPQQMYKPHTNSDRRRYVEEVDLDAPIYFWMDNPSECGISLSDALHSRVRRLMDREQTVFEGRGPSVSIRLEWPGYRQWSRQIPTKDFRTPPGPITKAKLAKNVAKCVQRFIQERQNHPLEDESDSRWRVGRSATGGDCIKLEDLILVSMHHVSMGSWQPQLRLARPVLP